MPSLDDFPSLCVQRATLKEDSADMIRKVVSEEMQVVCRQLVAGQSEDVRAGGAQDGSDRDLHVPEDGAASLPSKATACDDT